MHFAAEWLDADRAARLFARLEGELDWHQGEIVLFGRRRPIPRLQAWYGDPGTRYRYSGQTLSPLPWTRSLTELREHLREDTGIDFNAVLSNWYRDGRDSMGWHSDDEAELGRNPPIASLSLGAVRRFLLRNRAHREQRHELALSSGSLLLMTGPTQHHYQHSVPRTTRPVGARINLTFRRVCVRAGHAPQRPGNPTR